MTAPVDASAPPLPGRGIKPLDSLLGHTRAALLTFVVVVIAGLPVVFIKGVSKYQTTATIQVAPRYMKNLKDDNELDFQSNSQYRQYVEQQTKTINRFDVLEKALSSLEGNSAAAGAAVVPTSGLKLSLGLDGGGASKALPSAAEPNEASASQARNPWQRDGELRRRAIERLQRSLFIMPVPDTYLIQISLEGEKPNGLADIVNAVVAAYLDNAKVEQVYGADERVRQLKAREAELLKATSQLTLRRSDLARSLGVTAFKPGDGNPFDKLAQKLREEIADARSRRVEAEAKLAAFDKSGETDLVTRSILETVLIDPGLNSLKSSLNKRKADLVTTLSGLSPDHPGHQAAQQELREIDTEITVNTRNLTREVSQGLRKRYETAVDQTRQVEVELKRALQETSTESEIYAARFDSAVTLTEDLDQVRRELESVRERLNFFAIESTSPGFVRPVSAALPPDLPTGTGKKNLLLLVLVGAFGLALVVPVALDLLDKRVRTVNDAHRALGVPPMGWLIEETDHDSHLFAQDQLRRLATALMREQDRQGLQTVAFAAVKPGAGTTRLVQQLAICFNDLGVSAIALEANAFRPDPSFGQGPGLQQWLAGGGVPEPHVRGSLTHLGVGQVSHHRLDGLNGLQGVLAELTQTYRFVLIDAPPLLTSSDSELIVRAAGSVMAVVEAGGITMGELKRAGQLLEKLDPSSLGVVVNRVTPFHGGGYVQSLISEHLSGQKQDSDDAVGAAVRHVLKALAWDAAAWVLRGYWGLRRVLRLAPRAPATKKDQHET